VTRVDWAVNLGSRPSCAWGISRRFRVPGQTDEAPVTDCDGCNGDQTRSPRQREIVLSSRWLHLPRSRGLIALIGGIVVLAGIFQTNAGHAILRTAGLSQGSPGYTSLSFLEPKSLPEQLESESSTVEASFVILNATNTKRDYTWSIVLIRQGQANHVYTGSADLTSGGKAEITRSVTIRCTGGQIRMVVSLEQPAESISALMACHS
jgi:hypothetical protein